MVCANVSLNNLAYCFISKHLKLKWFSPFCSRVILSSGIEKGQEGYLLSMKTALANDLSRFKEVIVRLERSDMAYTADKVVELFSSPADCGGFVSFTW